MSEYSVLMGQSRTGGDRIIRLEDAWERVVLVLRRRFLAGRSSSLGGSSAASKRWFAVNASQIELH